MIDKVRRKPCSDETKKKISIANTGKRRTEEVRKLFSELNIGKSLSIETRKKIGDAERGEKHHYFGCKRSDDVKEKIRDAMRGRKHSDATREKMSKAHVGKIRSEEHKNRIAESKRGEKSHFWKGGISNHPDHKKSLEHKREALKGLAGGSFTVGEWTLLKKRYNYTCPMCGRQEPKIKLTVDHVIPISREGSSNIENIQPLCGPCNTSKYTTVYRITPYGELMLF